MQRLMLAAVFCLCAFQIKAQPLPPVSVFLTSVGAKDGWTDPVKGNQDSVKDLDSWIRHDYRKTLVLTDSRENAAIVLVVMGRDQQPITPGGRDYALRVNLLVPAHDLEAELSASASGGTLISGGAWYGAAGKIARDVDTWVTANRAKLSE